MSTNLDPTGGLPPEGTPPPPEQQVPQPPVIEPPAGQMPQPPSAPSVAADEAIAFYEKFASGQTRGPQFLATGRQYGFIPDGIESSDEVSQALAMYAEWKTMQGGGPPDPGAGVPQPPVPAQGIPQIPQDPGFQDPAFGDQGFQDPQYGADPEAIAQRVLAAIDQRDQVQAQQREQSQRVENMRSAVTQVAEGLRSDQQTTLLQNVALGVDTAVAQGVNIDFSVEAMTKYAGEVLASLQGMTVADQQAQQQNLIAQHRATAPRTTAPGGSPASGAPPSGPRGMEGVRQRIIADQAARLAGG